jgi:hypothetical protein
MSADTSVILVGENGWTDMARDLAEERVTDARDFHQPWWKGVKLYHRNGYRYEVENATTEEPVPAAPQDAKIAVQYEYTSTGFYQIEELKKALRDAIQNGSDVLTKFHDAGELTARVDAAKNFDDLVGMLEYAATEELEI